MLDNDAKLIEFYEKLDIEMEELKEKGHSSIYNNIFTFYNEMSIKIEDHDLCLCYFYWADYNNLEQIHIYDPWTCKSFQHDLN
ncbi:MAG: hypothetical protein M0R80_04200 [Proteobacteria bacterium]|nr:hypothetical protein [Pseudomonadota bacterium]